MENFYTKEQVIRIAKFSNDDLEEINKCRQNYNRLGFSHQLTFIRLFNRLPIQNPLEVID